MQIVIWASLHLGVTVYTWTTVSQHVAPEQVSFTDGVGDGPVCPVEDRNAHCYPQKVNSRGRILNRWFNGSPGVHIPNATSIGSSVLQGSSTLSTDTHTHTHTHTGSTTIDS